MPLKSRYRLYASVHSRPSELCRIPYSSEEGCYFRCPIKSGTSINPLSSGYHALSVSARYSESYSCSQNDALSSFPVRSASPPAAYTGRLPRSMTKVTTAARIRFIFSSCSSSFLLFHFLLLLSGYPPLKHFMHFLPPPVFFLLYLLLNKLAIYRYFKQIKSTILKISRCKRIYAQPGFRKADPDS